MDFFAVILFLILYFVHPQDWIPFLPGMNVVKPAMALGAFGLLTRGTRRPAWKFMGTPHEWVVVAYLCYCVWVDPAPYETTTEMVSFAGFYFLTAYALNTERRLEGYFRWWCFCIVLMAALGALTFSGLDVTHADEIIVTNMGRLALNTSLLDNPNALGHTIVTGLTLVYMMLVFRRPMGMRLLALPAFIVVGVCVFGTESKGAYISGAAALGSALVVGRKLWVQIIVGSLLFAAGWGASALLPRMVDRDAMRHDEGVMGRLLAFEAARSAYNTQPAGWKKFDAVVKWQGQDVSKATHSSYVQVGADLGPTGLFLYLSVLCCSWRSLLRYRTDSDSLERCRRVLFALIVGFAVSGWMITRPYHAEYFLLAGAATAYHRLAIERLRGITPDFGDAAAATRIMPAGSGPQALSPGDAPVVMAEEVSAEDAPQKRKFWNRYNLIDFGLAYVTLQFTVWCWDYIIENL